MINGLYTSASGMNAEMIRQDVVTNNLANISTVGFKKDEAIFTSFPNMMVHRINDRLAPGAASFLLPQASSQPLGVVGHGVQTHSTVVKFSDGSVTKTENPLDMAIQGNGLFAVELKDGSTAYTRAGNFVQNEAGQLSTQDGNVVLGINGAPINIDGGTVVVDTTGRVLVNGADAGTLKLEAWDPSRMTKWGEGLYGKSEADIEVTAESPNAPDAKVVQGYLEESNSKVIEGMVDMITVTRAYDANQKAIQIQDSTLDKVINEVGKV